MTLSQFHPELKIDFLWLKKKITHTRAQMLACMLLHILLPFTRTHTDMLIHMDMGMQGPQNTVITFF